MENEILKTNEGLWGEPEMDQILVDLDNEPQIYMSRPYSSLYDFEHGVASLTLNEHIGYFLDSFDRENVDYGRIYR